MRSSPKNSSPILTLEQVKAHFSQWRQTKTKGAKIPMHLWQEVFSLLGHYKITRILSTLGISTVQFRLMKAKLIGPDDKPPSANFVDATSVVNPVKPASQSLVANPQALIIDYQRPDGAVLSVKGLDIGEVHQFVTDFYGRA